MNGAQDLGGTMGHGPIVDEPEDDHFHAEWERRAFGLTLAMGFFGLWNIDEGRHARETLPPKDYLAFSYYEIWLAALQKLIAGNGLLDSDAASRGLAPPDPRAVRKLLSRGGPADRPATAPARFALGDEVTAKNLHKTGHTRLPGYCRRARGTIIAVHGTHVYPDDNAHHRGENPTWLYGVRFPATELWGDEANPNDSVCVDLWEPYLD